MHKRFLRSGLLSIVFIALAGSGCQCLKKVSIKPEAKQVAGTITVGADMEFEMGEPLCKEEKQIALQVKRGLANQYDRLLRSEITLETYNTFVKAAKQALDDVVYASKRTGAAGFEEARLAAIERLRVLGEAMRAN